MTISEGGAVVTRPNPLKQPFGVDFDAKGNMFIAELGGGRVLRLSPDNILTTIAGDGSKSYKGDGGPAKAAVVGSAVAGRHGGMPCHDTAPSGTASRP